MDCPSPLEPLFSMPYDYGERHAMVELLGVSTDQERAWVAHGTGGTTYDQPGSRRTIIEVDLLQGTERSRVEVAPTFDAAGEPLHVPSLGRLWPNVVDEAGVAWLGQIGADVAAWQGHGWFPVVASPDGRYLVHTRWPDRADVDADWLALRDAAGRYLGRVEPAVMRAVYEPSFSPDGEYIAYRGCRPYRGRGCLYDTYVEPVADHARSKRRLRSAFGGKGPLQGRPIDVNGARGDGHRFAPDGRHLFVLVHEKAQACVFRVQVETQQHERWACVQAEPQDRVKLLTAGQRGLVAVARRTTTGGRGLGHRVPVVRTRYD